MPGGGKPARPADAKRVVPPEKRGERSTQRQVDEESRDDRIERVEQPAAREVERDDEDENEPEIERGRD